MLIMNSHRISLAIQIVENHSMGLMPYFLVHIAVKADHLAGSYSVFSRRREGRNPLQTSLSLKIKPARHRHRVISDVLHVDFKVLVHHLKTATRLEREDLLHSGIHDYIDFEHVPVDGDFQGTFVTLAAATGRPTIKFNSWRVRAVGRAVPDIVHDLRRGGPVCPP